MTHHSPCAQSNLVEYVLCVLISEDPLVIHKFKLVKISDRQISAHISHHDPIDLLHRFRINNLDLIAAVTHVQFAVGVVRESPTLLHRFRQV